eukprot:Nitzschia sp. Nitz4//scaffold97_size77645//74237//74314//NITZ4_005530-RA/size77645-exonerate_protein2genome-gene-0.8-mRNA-1//-1//CDS//3329560692//4313//frame0
MLRTTTYMELSQPRSSSSPVWRSSD